MNGLFTTWGTNLVSSAYTFWGLSPGAILDNIEKSVAMMTHINDKLGNGSISVYGVMKSLALGVLVIFFLIELISKSISVHKMTFEMVVMMLIKLVLAKIMVDNCQQLLQGIEGLGQTYMTNVKLALGTIPDDVLETGQQGFMQLILGIVLFFTLAGTTISIYTVIYGRAIEIVLLQLISPIAIVSFGSDQFKGTGKKFLQDVASIALQLPIMIIIVVVVGFATSWGMAAAAGVNPFVATFVMKAILVSLFTKSRSMATKITGG